MPGFVWEAPILDSLGRPITKANGLRPKAGERGGR
jgi:hypothetical protein